MREHSIIDLITNSSTSVYIIPVKNALEKSKKTIQNLLNALNLQGKPEDYFDFYYEVDDDLFWVFYKNDEEDFLKIFSPFLQNENISWGDFKSKDDKSKLDLFRKFLYGNDDFFNSKKINRDVDYYLNYRMYIHLKIKAKNSSLDLMSEFGNLFETKVLQG